MKTVAVSPDAHVKVEPEIPQEPLEDAKVNPDPAVLFVRRNTK